MSINYNVDYYELIGVSETLTGARLKAKVLRFITDLDIEVRTTIPRRIRREGEEKLRRELGREPSNSEVTTYICEKTQNADTSKRDKEYVEKTIKLRLANEARQTLLDSNNKDQYDGVHNQARRAACYDHSTGTYGAKVAEKWFGRDDPGAQKWNSLYFCSSYCLKEHLRSGGGPKKGPNTHKVPCFKCGEREATGWKYRRPPKNLWYCDDCWSRVPNCTQCRTKKAFLRIEGKMFCSQAHFNEWQKEKNGPKSPPKPKTKQQYLQELTSLPGWELLTEDERDRFKDMIRNSCLVKDWENAITRAKILIGTKGGDEKDSGEEEGGGDNKNLLAEIQKAIREIEAELNKEPKITEKEPQNSQSGNHWRIYIKNSPILLNLKVEKVRYWITFERSAGKKS